MIQISKSFNFDAAHRLPNVPDGHKCGRMHGHTYVVELILRGEVDKRMGWFVDYADIAAAWEPLHAVLDHHTLNEIDGLDNPTTEVLVGWLWERLRRDPRVGKHLATVKVYESSSTWCSYSGPS